MSPEQYGLIGALAGVAVTLILGLIARAIEAKKLQNESEDAEAKRLQEMSNAIWDRVQVLLAERDAKIAAQDKRIAEQDKELAEQRLQLEAFKERLELAEETAEREKRELEERLTTAEERAARQGRELKAAQEELAKVKEENAVLRRKVDQMDTGPLPDLVTGTSS